MTHPELHRVNHDEDAPSRFHPDHLQRDSVKVIAEEPQSDVGVASFMFEAACGPLDDEQ